MPVARSEGVATGVCGAGSAPASRPAERCSGEMGWGVEEWLRRRCGDGGCGGERVQLGGEAVGFVVVGAAGAAAVVAGHV